MVKYRPCTSPGFGPSLSILRLSLHVHTGCATARNIAIMVTTTAATPPASGWRRFLPYQYVVRWLSQQFARLALVIVRWPWRVVLMSAAVFAVTVAGMGLWVRSTDFSLFAIHTSPGYKAQAQIKELYGSDNAVDTMIFVAKATGESASANVLTKPALQEILGLYLAIAGSTATPGVSFADICVPNGAGACKRSSVFDAWDWNATTLAADDDPAATALGSYTDADGAVVRINDILGGIAPDGRGASALRMQYHLDMKNNNRSTVYPWESDSFLAACLEADLQHTDVVCAMTESNSVRPCMPAAP